MLDEIKAVWATLTDQEKMERARMLDMKDDEPLTADQIYGFYRDLPTSVRYNKLCAVLGIKTSSDKLEEYSKLSAEAAKDSARSARYSLGLSLIATVISILALLLSAIGLAVGK